MSVFCTAYIIKMCLSVALSIYLILMAVSRVYLGAHSWNQVMFGLSLGLAFAFIGHYFVKESFYNFWDRCIEDGRYRTPWQELVKVLLFVIFFVFLSLVVLKMKISGANELLIDIEWRNRMHKNGCPDEWLSVES